MADINVTNNHSGALNVAGVDIRADATAAIDEKKLRMWANGNAAKIWIEQEVITFDGEISEEPDDSDEDQEPTREELLEKARELGLNPNGNTGIDKLKSMIAEAEE